VTGVTAYRADLHWRAHWSGFAGDAVGTAINLPYRH